MLSDFLRSQGQQVGVPPPQPPGAAAPLPHNFLTNLTAQDPQHVAPQLAALPVQQLGPPLPPNNTLAQQQQLLASAQLLQTVNPGLAAAAMAQALTMINNSMNPQPLVPPPPQAAHQQLNQMTHSGSNDNLQQSKNHSNVGAATNLMHQVSQQPLVAGPQSMMSAQYNNQVSREYPCCFFAFVSPFMFQCFLLVCLYIIY